LKTCDALSLPCCTPARINAIESGQGQPRDFGTDLILSAWITRNRLTQEAYEEWERAVINRLLAELKE
jgi:hypothetical protein